MKKHILVITLLFTGYQITQCAMLAFMTAASSKHKKPDVVVSGHPVKVKVKKGYKVVSANPYVISVHNNKDGSTEILGHKAGGSAFLHEIKEDLEGFFDDIGEFFTGVRDGIESKKKQGYKIQVAHDYNSFPTSMYEGDKAYVLKKPEDKFIFANKHDDDAGTIKIKHQKLDSDHNIVRLHATDSGKNPVEIKNANSGEIHKIMIHETK